MKKNQGIVSWMGKAMLLLMFFTSTVYAFAQAPGGISSGLTMWVRADSGAYSGAGVTPCTDGSTVQQWNNKTGLGAYNFSQATAGKRPAYYSTTTSKLFNFNPLIEFDPTGASGNGDKLGVTTLGTNLFGQNDLTTFMAQRLRTTAYTQVWFKWQDCYDASCSPSDRVGFENSGTGLRFDVMSNGTGSNNVSNPAGFDITTYRSVMSVWASSSKANAVYGVATGGSRVRIDGKEGTSVTANTGTANFATSRELSLGANNNLEDTYYSNLDISEVIIYNRGLVTAERDKVDSYMGIKYGISLFHDYVSAKGGIAWKYSLNPAYNYGIIGIARDDASALLQKQSKSMSRLVNASTEMDIITLHLSDLKVSNQQNTGTFDSGDSSFFLIGCNKATPLGTVTTENATSILKTLNREWLVQQLHFTNNDITIRLDLSSASSVFSGSACQKPILLLDADGNFSNATLVPDSVSLLVKNGNELTITVPYSIFQSTPYFTIGFMNKDDTASSTYTHPKCFGSSDGTINVNLPIGAATPVTYSNGGAYQASNAFTGLAAGTYYPIVKDNNGCLYRDTVVLTDPADMILTGDFYKPACFGYTNGKAFVKTITDGISPYTYLWDTGAVTDSINTGAGTHQVVVTDNNGCKDSVTVVITEPTKVDIDTVVTAASCPLIANGKIVATATGGTPGYTFNKNTGSYAASGTFSALATGTYVIHVKDSKGCLDSASVFIAAGPTPIVDAPNDTSVCPGATLKLAGSGTAGVTYSWTNGISNNVTFTVNATKKYVLTGTDVNGCKGTDSTTVTLTPVPDATINPAPSPICSDTTPVQLTSVNPGGSWRGTGITDATNGIFSPSVSGVGTFDIIYEIISGCSDDDTIKVTVTARKNATINAAGPFCTNAGVQQLTAVNPGGTWSGPGTNASGQFDPSVAGTGNHTITYSLGGTCPDTKTISISVNSAFNAQITPSGPYCVNGAAVQLQSVTAGASWSGPGITDANTGMFDPAVAGPGTHTITHTIAGSCGSTDTEQFVVWPRDTVHIILPNDSLCYDAPLTPLSADISGGTWTGAANAAGAFDPAGKAPGKYWIYYTYQVHCAYTDSATITIPDTLFASMANSSVSCFGGSNGVLTAVSSRGVSPYSYSWSNSAVKTAIQNNLAQGSYTATVTDALGCVKTAIAQITQPTQVTIPPANVMVVNDSCYHGNKGAVTLSATGGTPHPSTGKYTYSIAPVAGTMNAAQNGFDGLGAGNYTLTATDFNNCTATYPINITEPNLLQTYTSSMTDYCGQGIGSCTVDSTKGGTTPYTYKWNNGPTTITNTGLSAGSYTLTVTDKLNCIATSSVTVGNVPSLTVAASPVTTTCFNGTDGSATTAVNGATGAVTYTWSDGLSYNQPSRTNFPSDTFWIEVKDSQNCKDRDTFFIPQPADIFMQSVQGGLICYGTAYTGSYSASGGNGSPFTYYQNNAAQSSAAYSITSAGTYTVYATDQKGCYSDTITFTTTQNPDINFLSMANQTVCRGDVATFTANATGGVNIYQYAFDGYSSSSNNQRSYQTDQFTVSPQLVKVKITDGCSKPDSGTAYLNLHPDPVATVTYAPQKGCFPLTVNYTVTTNLSQYVLDPGDQTQLMSSSYTFNNPGTYHPNISGKTAQGCTFSNTLGLIGVSGYPVPDFDWDPQNPTVINNDVQFKNFTIGADKYNWYIMDSLLTDTIIESDLSDPHILMPDEAGTYGVWLRAELYTTGCADSLLKYITVEEEMLVYIPNAFTPNEDGINEVFKPSLTYVLPQDYRFEIYNRWGQRIFSTTELTAGWDGKVDGEMAKNDVYTYTLRYRKVNTSKANKLLGKFTLFR